MYFVSTFGLLLAISSLLVNCEYQSIDGSGNNVENPTWGQANRPLGRIGPINYADGYSHPIIGANSRRISDIVFANTTLVYSTMNLTLFVTYWGQMLAHELSNSRTNSKDPWPIRVPECDPIFDPNCTGTKYFNIFRTPYVNLTSHREQVSIAASFIDANLFYGTDPTWLNVLRSGQNGKMYTQWAGDTIGEMPYPNSALLPLGNDQPIGPAKDLYAVGETRGNENSILLSLHILFVREHNRLASSFAQLYPSWTDEELFQSSRRCVISYMQKITYDEWIPVFFGQNALGPYTGYNASLQPFTSNEFTTGGFRFGHSMLETVVKRIGPDGNVIPEGNILLRHAFFNMSTMSVGIEPYIRGMATTAMEIDSSVIDEVRNFLFGLPGSATGFDLISRNIERARDHGIAHYNQVRKALGLPVVTSFAEISSNPTVQQNLYDAYNGDVDVIDLFVGAIAEDHVEGSAVGSTFHALFLEQFIRTRASDRFWWENPDLADQIQICNMSDSSFANIIMRNTKNVNLPQNLWQAGYYVPSETQQSEGNTPTQQPDGITPTQQPDGITATQQPLNITKTSSASSILVSFGLFFFVLFNMF